MRYLYQLCLLAVFAVIMSSCSGGVSPILPGQDNTKATNSININDSGSLSGNPFNGFPVDEPYDTYIIHGETFSISAANGFQRTGLVQGATDHEVIGQLNSVQLDDVSSTAFVEFSLHNAGSIIYDAHLVIDELIPSGSRALNIDGTTPEGKPFWNFGIIPAGKTSPVRKLKIRFSSNQDISVSGHIEFKERAFIQWNDLILHTDGFDGNDIMDSPIYGEIVSNEVIARIPDGSNISEVYDYLKEHNLMPVGCDTALGSLELRILNKIDPDAVLAGLKSDSYLSHPEPNYVGSIEFYPDDHVFNPLFDPPSDPNRNRWAFERVEAVDAWDWYSDGVLDQSGNADVNFGTVLAIVDTGMIKHRDFRLSSLDIWVMDNLGKNFINTGQLPIDDHGHGTSVAGIAGATGNNSFLMAGMAWNPIFLPIKVCDYRGYYGYYSLELGLSYLAGIAFEYEDLAKIVINMSVGKHHETAPNWLGSAINYVDASSNTLLCAGAGNYKNNKSYYGVPFDISADNFYPAAFDACVSVGASSRIQDAGLDIEVFEEYSQSWGTNWGSTVDLCAPGSTTILTTSNESTIAYTNRFGGTSASTPFVSGTAALIWSKNPFWSKAHVKDAIFQNTDTMSLPPEKMGMLGTGRLNAFQAISVPPEADLLAYWPFDEGSGSFVQDFSGNNYDGTQSNTGNWGSPAEAYLGNSCFKQDVGRNCVEFPPDPLDNLHEGFIEFNIMIYQHGTTGYENSILSHANGINTSDITIFEHNKNINVELHYDQFNMNSGPDSIELNRWYNVKFVMTGKQYILYLDDLPVASKPQSQPLGERAFICVGNGTYGNSCNNQRPLKGRLDELKIASY